MIRPLPNGPEDAKDLLEGMDVPRGWVSIVCELCADGAPQLTTIPVVTRNLLQKSYFRGFRFLAFRGLLFGKAEHLTLGLQPVV